MVGSTAAGNAPQEGPRLTERQRQERLAAAEESAWLDGVYYQSMLMNHKAALFGRTHERMLRALYPPPPPAPQQQQQQQRQQKHGQDLEIWQRVSAFLEDAGGLMALRVQLLWARAAEPWMAPVPAAGARQVGASTAAADAAAPATATTQGGELGLGWRLAGRCLRDQHDHDYGRFRRRCQAHGPLLQAIEAEMGRLAAGLAALDQQQQQQQQQFPAARPAAGQAAVARGRGNAVAAPPALAQQLAAVDGAVLLESRLALWRRLHEAILTVVRLGPGENLGTAAAEEEQQQQGSGSGVTGQGQSTESSSMLVVLE